LFIGLDIFSAIDRGSADQYEMRTNGFITRDSKPPTTSLTTV